MTFVIQTFMAVILVSVSLCVCVGGGGGGASFSDARVSCTGIVHR